MLMVRKAGMALLMLFQSIWAALIIMREPVRISAGPVQYTGMEAVQRTHFSQTNRLLYKASEGQCRVICSPVDNRCAGRDSTRSLYQLAPVKGREACSPMMGVNQRAMNIQKATVRPTMPVLPPSLIPVADSAHEQETTSGLRPAQEIMTREQASAL